MNWNKKINILDFNLGIDIVFKKKIISANLNKAKRILTEKEFNKFVSLRTKKQKREYLSGRWAAKEAIFKSLPNNLKLSLFNIEVLNYDSGQPYCTNFENIRLSISHSQYYVICCCAYLIFN